MAISRPLAAGAYRLELKQAVPPDVSEVAARDAPAAASGGDTESDRGDDDKPASDAAEPNAQSKVETARSDPSEREQADEGTGKPKTEITLALPAALEPVAAGGVTELTGAGVHRLLLAQPQAGRLVVASARSSVAVVVSLERQEMAGWRVVAQEQGLAPVVAVPADAEGAPWRLAIWTVDGGGAPVRVMVEAVDAGVQAPGVVALRMLEGSGVAVARVHLDGPQAVRLAGGDLLAGGWPGHGLMAPDDGVAVSQSDTLWILARTAGTVLARVLVAVPGQAVAVPVGGGSAARLAAGVPASGLVRGWRAESGLGQPGLDAGQGMGVASGSAFAVGTAPVRVWNAGDDSVLRPRVTALDFAMQAAMRVDAPVAVLVPAGGALHLTLPEGERRTDLALAPGMAAVAGTGEQAITVWTGDMAQARSLPGGWMDLVLLNSGSQPAPASVAWTMGASLPLQPGAVVKRFFGASGAFDMQVEAPAGARLRLAGDVQATFLGADGRVQRGGSLVLAGPGRLTLAHAPGPLAVWLETPDSTAWPAVAARPQTLPARVTLGGEMMALALAIQTPALLHARTTAPVILTLGQDAPTLYPAGAVLNRYVAAATVLRIDSPQDGPLTGSLELEAEPVTPIAEGLGAPVALAPGESAVFAFQVPRATAVGVGVRAEPGLAHVRLLAADGDELAEGAAMLRRLEAGRYLIDVRLPPDAPATIIRPAVVGITPRGAGPPPEVARSYLALVGLAPKDGAP